MISRIATALVAGAAFMLQAAWAQPADCTKSSDPKSCVTAGELLGKLDLAVPENALFSLLGATPDTIIRPKLGDKIATSLLPQVVDALGNEQYALAVEINPGLLSMPPDFTMAELLNDPSADVGRRNALRNARNLSQFTLSAAASRATGDNTITQYGLGVNWTYDSGSPFNSQAKYGECIKGKYTDPTTGKLIYPSDAGREAALEVRAKNPGWINPATDRAFPDKAAEYAQAVANRVQEIDAKQPLGKNAVAQCSKEVAPWNRDTYGAGVAAYYSETDPLNSTTVPPPPATSETGFGVWATGAFAMGKIVDGRELGFDPHGQFVLTGRYTQNLVRERKVGNAKVTETVDGWRIGARYVHRFSDNSDDSDGAPTQAFRGFVEAAYNEEKFGNIDDEFAQAGIGFEVQVQKDLYLQAVIGDTFGSAIDRSTYFTGQLKWSFSGGPAK